MAFTNELAGVPDRKAAFRGMRLQKRTLALVLYFVVFSGSIYLLFGGFDDGSPAQKSGDSPLYLGLLLITYSVLLYQLTICRGAALAAVVKAPLPLLFIFSGVISLFVAGAAGISAMRYVLYVLTIGTGLVISIRYSLEEFCETFFYTSFVITVANFLAYPLLAGRIVYDPLERPTLLGVTAYAGLFPHKSVAATFFSLALIVSLARYLGARSTAKRRSSILLVCLSVVALVIAGAVGRLLVLIISSAVTFAIRAYLQRNLTSLILIGMGLILGSIAYIAMGDDTWIYLFGRNWNLTGRAELFDLWPRFFWEKPIFGYGFDGFFTDVAGSAGGYLSDLNGGKGFSTFESVYMDLLIEFGLVGGLVFACILLRALWKSTKFYAADRSKYRFVPLLLMVWIIAGAALDNGITHQNTIDCIILFWIYFGLESQQPRPIKRVEAFSRFGSVSRVSIR